jgi:hypothetical protein
MPAAPKAPWTQRFGVVFFTILAGVLVFWLLGFVVDDIGEIPGPQQTEVETRLLDPALVKQLEGIEKESSALGTQIENEKARQTLLRDSTTSSQQTMNQLLDMQKQNAQNRVAPSEAERNALARSETLFIANQTQYQALNEEIARRSEQQRGLELRKTEIEERLNGQREKAAKELASLQESHHLRVAALQLLFLLPILLLATWFILKRRGSMYAALIYAFAAPTLVKVVLVIHENFPTRYFKYIVLLASLAVVVRMVVYLTQATKSPKMAALLKQYREAYERFLCPICEYPIRRGPMKFAYWTRRNIRKVAAAVSSTGSPDEPYTCPSCGSHLFEVCPHCQHIRHVLLPFCEHCGEEKVG